MIYGIASYNRQDVRTLKTLLEAGVEKKDIVISTQCEKDYYEYRKAHDVRILYRKTDCAGGNRNTILDAFCGEDILLLDDDITSFCVFSEGRFRKNNAGFIKRVPWMFSFSRKNGATLFGVSATENNLTRKARFEFDFKVLLQGSVIGFINQKIRFDERFKMLEDYELSLREQKSCGLTMRFNDYSIYKPKNGTNKGGMNDRYKKNELPFWVDALKRRHPEFLPNKDKNGGIALWKKEEW